MAVGNVWLRDLEDRLVAADQLTEMYVDRVPGLGWTVIVETRTRSEPVLLADFGRGGSARTGADHLLARLPSTIAAAAAMPHSGCVITYTPGIRKGLGDWSTTTESGPVDAAPAVAATRGPLPTPAVSGSATPPTTHADPKRPTPPPSGDARNWPSPWDSVK